MRRKQAVDSIINNHNSLKYQFVRFYEEKSGRMEGERQQQ